MGKRIFMLIGAVALLGLSGCGNKDQSISANNEESKQQSTVIDNLEENETADTEVVDNSGNESEFIEAINEISEATIEVLLNDGKWYVFATEDVKANWNKFIFS
jgi:hypothetical protein